MEQINSDFFIISLSFLFAATIFSIIFASLRATGDAGIARLIERDGKHAELLKTWHNRWGLMCKTSRLILTFLAIGTFVFLYLALQNCSVVTIIILLIIFCFPYMILARIVPYILAESYADRISLLVFPFIRALTLIMFVFVWPLQFIENQLLSQAMKSSDEEDRPSPEDEIKSLIEETDEEELEEEEREIIRSVFEFGDTVTREIMTPRIDINGLKDTLTVDECIAEVKESRHSRFPIYHESIDEVIGVVHVKDLLMYSANNQGTSPISQLVKKISFVPESMPINDLMQLMKQNQTQLVLVVDEYGGTEGLVTMEDIIEELVGEIEDEYDLSKEELHRKPDGSIIAQARIPIDEINDELGIKLPESDEYDSLGGLICTELGHIPRPGEKVQINGYTLKVQSATNRQIQAVQLNIEQ